MKSCVISGGHGRLSQCLSLVVSPSSLKDTTEGLSWLPMRDSFNQFLATYWHQGRCILDLGQSGSLRLVAKGEHADSLIVVAERALLLRFVKLDRAGSVLSFLEALL